MKLQGIGWAKLLALPVRIKIKTALPRTTATQETNMLFGKIPERDCVHSGPKQKIKLRRTGGRAINIQACHARRESSSLTHTHEIQFGDVSRTVGPCDDCCSIGACSSVPSVPERPQEINVCARPLFFLLPSSRGACSRSRSHGGCASSSSSSSRGEGLAPGGGGGDGGGSRCST